MIFGRRRISCDDFGDYHDKVVVASVDFIGKRSIYGLQGDTTPWHTFAYSYLLAKGGFLQHITCRQ
jgi:hypothetical protein